MKPNCRRCLPSSRYTLTLASVAVHVFIAFFAFRFSGGELCDGAADISFCRLRTHLEDRRCDAMPTKATQLSGEARLLPDQIDLAKTRVIGVELVWIRECGCPH